MFKMLFFRFVLCIGIVAATVKDARAISEDQKKFLSKVMDIRDHCLKNFGVPNEQVGKAISTGHLSLIDPCYFECLYKKLGILNYQGKYNVTVANEYLRRFLNTEEEFRKAVSILKQCVAVNDEKFIYKGCDRGKFIAVCFDKFRVMKLKNGIK